MDGINLQIEMGLRIEKLRLDRGMTQEQLGNALGGINRVTIGKYEKGKQPVPVDVLRNMCEFFHVPADYLLCFIINKKHKNTDIGARLGLSDEAILQLEETPRNAMWLNTIDAVNFLLEEGFNYNLFYTIGLYINSPSKLSREDFEQIDQDDYYGLYLSKTYRMHSLLYEDHEDPSKDSYYHAMEFHSFAMNRRFMELLDWRRESKTIRDKFVKKFIDDHREQYTKFMQEHRVKPEEAKKRYEELLKEETMQGRES